MPLAEQAEILQEVFAGVDIAAVIDEATGYQRIRGNDALRILLGRYIADGLRKWLNTFPDSFFAEDGRARLARYIGPFFLRATSQGEVRCVN